MDIHAKIYVAGHRGLVGSAIVRRLEQEGYTNIVVRTHAELDLRDAHEVADFFAAENQRMYFSRQHVSGESSQTRRIRQNFSLTMCKFKQYHPPVICSWRYQAPISRLIMYLST
jgi:nucleoside-diphosphate-sugar epimerase